MKRMSIVWALLILNFTYYSTAVSFESLAQAKKATLRLRENSPARIDPVYNNILRPQNNTKLSETEKILYLIEQIKLSPHRFERNGTVHSGEKAASHLRRKYGFTKSRLNTADEFVHHVAARSSTTGEPYLVIDSQGNRHPLRKVLLSELAFLEKNFTKNDTSDPPENITGEHHEKANRPD